MFLGFKKGGEKEPYEGFHYNNGYDYFRSQNKSPYS